MHFLDFFSIVERDLDILNPSSLEKLILLADYCHVQNGSSVLDIGSGKGYLLRTWAERWRIEGTGLELNPVFVQEARTKAGAEGVAKRVTFVEGPAVEFSPSPTYDVVTCIGAPFAIGSFIEAVAWMKKALKPTGVLAIGDEVLLEPLPQTLMAREGVKVGEYQDFSETAAALTDQGLNLTGLVAASPDDWDRYASGSWRRAHAFARARESPGKSRTVAARGRRQSELSTLAAALPGLGCVRGPVAGLIGLQRHLRHICNY